MNQEERSVLQQKRQSVLEDHTPQQFADEALLHVQQLFHLLLILRSDLDAMAQDLIALLSIQGCTALEHLVRRQLHPASYNFALCPASSHFLSFLLVSLQRGIPGPERLQRSDR